MGVALDSTLFIDIVRGRAAALRKLDEIESRPELKVIPTPVVYEISAGILRARSRTQEVLFRNWIARFQVAPLDLSSAESAALLRAELLDLGRIKPTGDILTAGIALSGGHSLVTRDVDFREISKATGLRVESYD